MSDDSKILGLVRAERSNTIGAASGDSELSKQRAQAIDYYHGKMDDFPPLPGWSKATSRDVFETIESAMPDLMDIFASDEDVMEFIPEAEDDVEAAAQETDVVNQIFYQENKGFLILYTFIKDSLMVKNGFVKSFWNDEQSDTQEQYFDQTEDDLTFLKADDNIEITDITKKVEKTGEFTPKITVGADGELTTGEPEEIVITTFDVIAKKSKDASGVVVQAVPPEEISISRDSTDLQTAALVRHEPTNVTRSDLLAMGISKDVVSALPETNGRANLNNEEEVARDNVLNEDDISSSSNNWTTQRVSVADNYILMDLNGNGKSERWHVMTGSKDTVVLSKTRINRVPISTMTPIIETHKMYGLSLADLVMDLQRIKTFLIRGALDNAAAMNNQRPIINELQTTDSTIDDILINRPAAPIMVKGDANTALSYATNQNITGDLMGFSQQIDVMKVERTGITRFGQAVDPNALRKDMTATEFSGQNTNAQKTIRLIARIFAETGLRDMFITIHELLLSHSGEEKRSIQLNGKFVDINPREWRSRTNMSINVGLGTGTKAEQIGQLGQILEQQKIAYATQGNQDGPLVTLEQIRFTLSRIIKLQGFKTADSFFNKVDKDTKQDKPEEQPDPALVKIQADAANDKEKNAIEHQKNVMNAQVTKDDNDKDRELKLLQIVLEIELKADTLGKEFDFKAAVAEAKLLLESQKLQLDTEVKGIDAALKISTNLTPDVRLGGDIAG